MPSPTSSLATLRPDLQAFFQYSYAEGQRYFIGQQVFPIFPVPEQSGNFGKVTLSSMLENSTPTNRAPLSGYNRRRYEFTSDSYATEENGIEELVDDRQAKMYANYLAAEVVAMQRALNTILTAAERRVAAIVADAAYYTAAASRHQTPAALWSAVGANPVADVESAWQKLLNNTGIRGNALIVNEKTFRTLRNNQVVIDRIASSGAGSPTKADDITAAQMAAVFGIDRVLVAGGIYNSANVNASPAITSAWPNHAMVCRIATTNDMMEPCIGRTFHWSEDGSLIDGRVESYREESSRSTVIRVRHETQEKALYRDLGVMIENVLS